jgi:fucose 4-O-acetylase-like acetyltransferase
LNRINILDTARGFLILHIVLITHGIFWIHIFPQWVGFILLFEMPAIFMVSGYAFYISQIASAQKPLATLTTKYYSKIILARSTRILVPYFVYAVICIPVMYLYFLESDIHVTNNMLGNLLLAWLNPFNYGKDYSFSTLNLHLWFIPVYLIITGLMPIATKFRPLKNPNFLAMFIGLLSFAFLLTKIHFEGVFFFKTAGFYFIFSMLGYYIAYCPEYFKRINYTVIAVISSILLASIVVVDGNFNQMNMQVNKFPPNHIFFLFTCIWMSLILFILFKSPKVVRKLKQLDQYNDSFWLKPFVKSGYSIYLYQGLAYTIAIYLGKTYHLHLLIVWVVAFFLSVLMGLIAAPLESVRLNIFKK